jgi:hypothetical protein
MTMNKIATKTFTAPLKLEGSWGAMDMGTHESTMTLYIHPTEPRGFIEWDVPRLDDTEEIGLRFDHAGKNAELTDYDGVHSLPIQAIEMLREAGFVVSKEFE